MSFGHAPCTGWIAVEQASQCWLNVTNSSLSWALRGFVLHFPEYNKLWVGKWGFWGFGSNIRICNLRCDIKLNPPHCWTTLTVFFLHAQHSSPRRTARGRRKLPANLGTLSSTIYNDRTGEKHPKLYVQIIADLTDAIAYQRGTIQLTCNGSKSKLLPPFPHPHPFLATMLIS